MSEDPTKALEEQGPFMVALGVQAYTEALANTLHTTRDTQGIPGLTKDVTDAGDLGHEARVKAEQLIGEPIDTPDNFLHLSQKSKKKLPKAKSPITRSTLFDENITQEGPDGR